MLQGKTDARKKDWIYIWYRGQVMVRNEQYAVVAKENLTGPVFTRYEGPFKGENVKGHNLSEQERAIKEQFMATLDRLAKTRRTSLGQDK